LREARGGQGCIAGSGGRKGAGAKIRTVSETIGVEFIDENGGGPGVRLGKRQRAKAAK
jgi:hypothetical protein